MTRWRFIHLQADAFMAHTLLSSSTAHCTAWSVPSCLKFFVCDADYKHFSVGFYCDMLRSLLGTLCRHQFSLATPRSSFSKVVRNVIAPTSYNTMKAYIKTSKDDGRVEIKFRYVDETYGLDRWFTLNRSVDDSIQQIIERLTTNIDKATAKYRKKLEKKLGKAPEFSIDIQFQDDTQKLGTDIALKDFLVKTSSCICVNGQKFYLEIDPPAITTIKLPASVMAGFPVYPSKLELENCEVKDCIFQWYKSPPSLLDPPEIESELWIPIGAGLPLETTNSDIGCFLKLECTPKSLDREGLTQSVLAPHVVEAGPGLCPFENRHSFTREKVDETGFRVVTYNILADLYADSDYTRTVLHPYCHPYALAIDYRKQLIVKELKGYNADIICLQEVDVKVFDYDLQPIFSTLGYTGIFNKKGGQVSEGVACFVNASKFKVVDTVSYIVAEELPNNPLLADYWNIVKQKENLAQRVLNRTTSCQLVVLESLANGKRVVVANTHLYFHPDADHIRLLQAGCGLRFAHDMRERHLESGKEVSLIFCGDFNSCPDSGVLELMTLQKIPDSYAGWSSNKEEAIIGLELHNPVAMESACGTPLFTNYTPGFNGCIDYIFYEKSKLEVQQVVPLPSFEEVTQHTGLPSIVFPSDHIALITDLKWL